MCGRDDVELVRYDQRGRVCSDTCYRLNSGAGPWIDGFYQSRLADRHVDATGGGIEEGDIRRTGDRPDIGDLAGGAVDLDQRTVVTGGVEASTRMVDVETMGAT